MTPSRRLAWVLAAWAAAGFLLPVGPFVLPVWAYAGLAIFGLLGIDAILGSRRRTPTLTRKVQDALPLGDPSEVVLHLAHEGSRPLAVEVFDHPPEALSTDGLPLHVTVRPETPAEVRYRVTPTARGSMRFDRAWVRFPSPLGLWECRRRAGAEHTIRVFPNFRKAARWSLYAVDNHASRLGVRLRPRRGEGTELRELREYREGDAIRQIDWKATSRLRRPISREYQAERDQQVVFLLDCGRTMRAVDDGAAHFDHALNAVLLLGYVALRQGDAVGLLAFGSTPRWLEPVRGPGGMKTLLEAVYDLETAPQASDYAVAVADLLARQRRRALVVVISNLGDGEGFEVAAPLQTLRRKHLVVLGSLREAALDRALAAPVAGFDAALRIASTHRFLEARERAHRGFQSRGIHVLDCPPSELPPALVNRYLDIKRAGTL
ncbi:MAG TPA: DUF58 domain-containing protein [Candidatus Polarisedimenticolaceae bacterium]